MFRKLKTYIILKYSLPYTPEVLPYQCIHYSNEKGYVFDPLWEWTLIISYIHWSKIARKFIINYIWKLYFKYMEYWVTKNDLCEVPGAYFMSDVDPRDQKEKEKLEYYIKLINQKYSNNDQK